MMMMMMTVVDIVLSCARRRSGELTDTARKAMLAHAGKITICDYWSESYL